MSLQLYNFAKKTVLSLVYKLPALPERNHGKLIWAYPRAWLSLTAKTFFKEEAHVQNSGRHPYWLPTQHSSTPIVELLKAYGYKIFNLKGKSVESLHSGEYLCLSTQAELH
jgi:hypothetical protein